MHDITSFGQVPWSRKDMMDKLEEFASLYEKRPIKDNVYGMRSPHLFMAWFALKTLNPKVIVESGIYLGQGTWFFEQACPDAELYCIDIDLKQIQYKSSKARYFDQDFSTLDWTDLPVDETVLFFDDHQNAYERVKTAKWFGFRDLILEDNYPSLQGDCYSLKKAFMHAGYGNIPPNATDEKYLKRNIETYYEFPPVFKMEKTRWKDAWDNKNYPTPEPLLQTVEKDYHQMYFDEALYYTWICYVRLK